MDSPQPKMVSNSNSRVQNPTDLSKESGVHREENVLGKQEKSIGILEVYFHQARDIHNICIYHKQDVYAKIFLTSDPETTVSTQIINGGGKNPIFNETLRLDVRTLDSSLKCEIWMLSRVRNYLEDQLLGFALVPLSIVITGKGKLEEEFSLSSSDLFHSPAGFVQMSLSYTGASPEVLEISNVNLPRLDSEEAISVPNELDKIEFPDPKIVNENEMMVSEYFGTENLRTADNGTHLNSEDTRVQIVEVLSMGDIDSVEIPPSGASTSASDTLGASKPLNQDGVSSPKGKIEDAGEAERGSNECEKLVINVNIEPEQKVVQQDIVDMYMKSMQQFTESLAKMKLPLDVADLGDTGSDEKVKASKSNGQSPRVFYGSRAFF